MTREEAIEVIEQDIPCEHDRDLIEALEMAISALSENKGEPKTEQFAKWVAREIFDDDWEYNKDAFAEIACRKLAKLGMVKVKGDKWELIESRESEGT